MEVIIEATPSSGVIRLFKYRWIELFIYCLFTIINFAQVFQFTIITNIITEYYGISTIAVDATGLMFFIVYIILFVPISYLIERYNLRVTAIVSTALTVAGNLIKLLCADPNRFYTVLLGQAVCAIGQVYMLSIPSKLASAWFGQDEVSTACAIAVLGTQLGAALGFLLPPFLVKNEDSTDISENLLNMMIYNATVSAVIFVIVIVFFRAKPKLPPSRSQLELLQEENNQFQFMKHCRVLVRNKNFLLLLLSFGVFSGLWNSFGIVVNGIYTNYFPHGEHDIGIITLLAIVSGGCVGSIVFGLILDKTHQFKRTSLGVMLSSFVSFIFVGLSLIEESRVATYFTIPIFGFFTASALVISFEYTLEETYPIPEAVSCSIMNATVFVFAIINTLVIEGLIDAIGYIYCFVVILAILLFCASLLFLISTNLRRRDANLTYSN